MEYVRSCARGCWWFHTRIWTNVADRSASKNTARDYELPIKCAEAEWMLGAKMLIPIKNTRIERNVERANGADGHHDTATVVSSHQMAGLEVSMVQQDGRKANG